MATTDIACVVVKLVRAIAKGERPSASNFSVEKDVNFPTVLVQGDVLVRTVYVSVDPYLFQYALLQPSSVGQVVKSRGVGIVEASKDASFPVGSFVFGTLGWRSHSVHSMTTDTTIVVADGSTRVVTGADALRIIVPAGTTPILAKTSPLPRYLGVLGIPGLTAYAGVKRILQPKAGSQIFISSAAGAVGLVAGQVCKQLGARVVGCTGSDEKCQFLLDHGFDVAFNYKTERTTTANNAPIDLDIDNGYANYVAALGHHFPQGIDGYFDCVGGAMLDAVLHHANEHAAIAVCGIISTLPPPTSPDTTRTSTSASAANHPATKFGEDYIWKFHNFSRVLTKSIRMQGFQARDHYDLMDEYHTTMNDWLDTGKVVYREAILRGIENLPTALMHMLDGKNLGKQLVQVSDDPLLSSN
eukprot:m.11351 g.11351  ORF g.11351 m.11351 type:complete len:414 (+) comp8768_c0_seq1:177-1418(+)